MFKFRIIRCSFFPTENNYDALLPIGSLKNIDLQLWKYHVHRLFNWRDVMEERSSWCGCYKKKIWQGNLVKKRRGEDLDHLTLWLFACNGLTENEKKIMEENGILWSTKKDLDALLRISGLRELPEID